jgi:hypothetical protein
MRNIPKDERVDVTSENFGDLLIASAKEALAIARDEMAPARITYASTTARTVRVATPPPFDAERVRALRRRLDLSQSAASPAFAGCGSLSMMCSLILRRA